MTKTDKRDVRLWFKWFRNGPKKMRRKKANTEFFGQSETFLPESKFRPLHFMNDWWFCVCACMSNRTTLTTKHSSFSVWQIENRTTWRNHLSELNGSKRQKRNEEKEVKRPTKECRRLVLFRLTNSEKYKKNIQNETLWQFHQLHFELFECDFE